MHLNTYFAVRRSATERPMDQPTSSPFLESLAYHYFFIFSSINRTATCLFFCPFNLVLVGISTVAVLQSLRFFWLFSTYNGHCGISIGSFSLVRNILEANTRVRNGRCIIDIDHLRSKVDSCNNQCPGVLFGQWPRRGRSPVEHRGTFVHLARGSGCNVIKG